MYKVYKVHDPLWLNTTCTARPLVASEAASITQAGGFFPGRFGVEITQPLSDLSPSYRATAGDMWGWVKT